LYDFFGRPEVNDDDSVLACAVAAVRWRGYMIDPDKINALKVKAQKSIAPVPTAPIQVRKYITEFLDQTERLVLQDSTKRVLLETISKWVKACPDCQTTIIGDDTQQTHPDLVSEYDAPEHLTKTKIEVTEKTRDCKTCNGTGTIQHPAAERATEVLNARKALKEIELYDKLLLAGRFHASFKVIGTLSSRMSGADGLNAQGIKNVDEVRDCFPLWRPGEVLDGGDFAAFEVTLADACYGDPDLRRDLLLCEDCDGEMYFNGDDFICKTCNGREGKKIHALFGTFVFPDMTYDEIKATKGTADDKYTNCKRAVFAMFYGGEGETLKDRLGVDLEIANNAYIEFTRKYKKVGEKRQEIINMFCSMKQPGGIGTQVIWEDPAEKIESMFGFARYFTLENSICKALFELANKPPRSWRDIKIKVVRRDRQQTASGALQSALYAAAFALQGSNTRAAVNHVIQSSGATCTKCVQRAIWDLQPPGANTWLVQPMNVHDEILNVCVPWISDRVKQVVKETVETFRDKVPLIKIDWKQNLKSWMGK